MDDELEGHVSNVLLLVTRHYIQMHNVKELLFFCISPCKMTCNVGTQFLMFMVLQFLHTIINSINSFTTHSSKLNAIVVYIKLSKSVGVAYSTEHS